MSAQVPVNVQLTAVLKDNTGAALQGATINFSYKLSSAAAFTSGGSAVTDSTGTATMTLALMAPDTYDFTAAFNGSSMFAASNVMIVFDTTARLPQTQLTVQVQPLTSASANVSGVLSSSGTPIPAATISVSVDGTHVGNATTDSSGAYAFQLLNLSPQAHTITVNFAGSAFYAPSQASATFGGTGGPAGKTIALIAGGATIIGTMVVFMVVRKKK